MTPSNQEELLTNAKDMGYAAYVSGKQKIDNPYVEGTLLYRKWKEGFVDAMLNSTLLGIGD